jgi:hypothetical protein
MPFDVNVMAFIQFMQIVRVNVSPHAPSHVTLPSWRFTLFEPPNEETLCVAKGTMRLTLQS